MRTIKVTGKGRLKLRPDTTRVTIMLEGKYPEYEQTLKSSTEDTEKLRDAFSQIGFKPEELKTLSFNIDTDYETFMEDNVYKNRFAGYRYNHMMKVEFSTDNEKLGQILYMLANSPVHPEFRLEYTVSDPEAAKNELLADAVRDAKKKAAVLADAAALELGDIQGIDYSWGEIDFTVQPMNSMMRVDAGVPLAKGAGYDMAIEPDDISAEDNVTVIWEIR